MALTNTLPVIKKLNGYSNTKCLRCGDIENRDHVVKCTQTIEIQNKLEKTVFKEISKLATKPKIRADTLLFLKYIMDFLTNKQVGETTQNLIRFKELFRGYIVKDWFSKDETETKYSTLNEMFVLKCVMLYNKC